MNPFQKYRYIKGTDTEPDNMMELVEKLGALIDQTAVNVFQSHVIELLTRPITYIIPAVWGSKKDGELTFSQKQMNSMIAPVIEDIFQSLDVETFTESQQFAVGYLVRGLMISKITYMIEKMKNQLIEKIISDNRRSDSLTDVETIGNA